MKVKNLFEQLDANRSRERKQTKKISEEFTDLDLADLHDLVQEYGKRVLKLSREEQLKLLEKFKKSPKYRDQTIDFEDFNEN